MRWARVSSSALSNLARNAGKTTCLLGCLVGGQLLDDAQEQAADLGGIVRGVELLGEPVDRSVVAQQKLDDVDLVGHRRILPRCTATVVIISCVTGSSSDSAKGPSPRAWRAKCSRIRDRRPGTAPDRPYHTIEVERAGARPMTDDRPPSAASTPRPRGDVQHEAVGRRAPARRQGSPRRRSAPARSVRDRAARSGRRAHPAHDRRQRLRQRDRSSLVIQAVGKSTSDLVALAPGDRHPRHRRSARPAERSGRRGHRCLRGRRRRRGRDASRSPDGSPSSAPT